MLSFKLIFILCLFCVKALAQYSLTSGVYGHFIQDLSSTTWENFNTEASTWKVFNAINSSNPSNTYNSTNSSALVYGCNTYILRGGDGILQSGGYFQKTYTGLPVHDIIYFSFYFDILGTGIWSDNDYFNITFDTETIGSNWRFNSSSYYNSYVCGSNYETIIGLRPVGKVYHIANSLTITITSNIISSGASFGFRQVALNLANKTTYDVENSCYTSSNSDLYGSAAGCQAPEGWASYTWIGCYGGCDQCFGWGTTTECYNCATYYGFNGQSCVPCYSGCLSCLDSSVNTCTKCWSGYYHYWNNTCISSCDSSKYYQIFNLENDCRPLCQLNNTFTYWDDSCNTTCEFPLVQSTINGVKSCIFPCAAGDYLYSNGTCSSTCTFTAWTFLGQNMCKIGCLDPHQYYYPSDNTCNTTCPKPLTAYTSSFTGLTCISNCPSASDYLFADGSCSSTRPAYRLVTSLANILLCENACINGYYFHTYDSVCRTTCVSPLQPLITGSNSTCVYPCLRTQILNTNGLCSDTCLAPFYLTLRPEGFYICNSPCPNSSYYYQESNTCKSTCPYPYTVVPKQGANFCTLIITPEERDQAAQANAITDGGGTTASAGAVVASILSSGDPASLGAGSLVKLMQYMKFIDIGYPPKLYVMLREQKIARAGITFAPAIDPTLASKFPYQPLPQKFEDAGVPSSFFVNMWELTITLAITLAATLAIILLEKVTKGYPKLNQIIQKVKVALKWNLLLTIFFSNFGDISLYSALELSMLSFDSLFSVLSFIQCLIFNAFILFVVLRAAEISRYLHHIRKTSPPEVHNRKIGSLYKKWESYQMLFQGFHNISVLQQMFTLNLVIRAYIINLVVGLLYAYPLAQTIFLTASSCCMIIYLLIKMPMLSRLNNIQQIVFEIIVLIVNVCLLTLSILDNNGTVNASLRVTIGNVVLGTNVAMGIISPTFLALKLCVIVYDVYSARKASKNAQTSNIKTNKGPKRMPFGYMNTVQKLPRARLKVPVRQTRQIITDMRPLDLSSNTLSQNTSYKMSQGTQNNMTNFS